MKTLIKHLEAGINHFGSSTRNSPAFDVFYKSFKSKLTKQLREVGASDITFSKGHFYLSGFFTMPNGQAWYFSLSDVRSNWGTPQLLYRTATSYKDYTGGSNQYVNISEDMVKQMRL